MALRLHNKEWVPLIFLGGSLGLVLAWFRFAKGHPPELLLSCVGALAGFAYFIYRQHLDETKLFKELFVEFNARYDKLNEGLNDIVWRRDNGDLSEQNRQLLFSYFNLCAEELFFYKAGYIDHNVWRSWQRGMKVFFGDRRVRELWKEDCQIGSYYGFQPE